MLQTQKKWITVRRPETDDVGSRTAPSQVSPSSLLGYTDRRMPNWSGQFVWCSEVSYNYIQVQAFLQDQSYSSSAIETLQETTILISEVLELRIQSQSFSSCSGDTSWVKPDMFLPLCGTAGSFRPEWQPSVVCGKHVPQQMVPLPDLTLVIHLQCRQPHHL